MIDISTAREKLLEQERLRPAPGQFSALWEQGVSWQQAFSELVGAERSRDTLFEQLVDAAQGFEARRERLQQWLGGLNESLTWFGQHRNLLGKHQRLWNVDEHGRSLAPNDLFTHQALLDIRIIACKVRRTLVELEYLEHRRRAYRGLDEDEWQRAFAELQQALREQGSSYRQWYGGDLPERFYTERLRWCERLNDIQRETLDLWRDRRDVDSAGLRADMSMLERMMQAWRPSHNHSGSSLPVLIGVGLVIAVIIAFAGSGGPSNSKAIATPTQERAQVSPTKVQAAASPPDDLGTLNEEGKQLLKQGRCEEAIQRFQSAFDANPTAHEAYEPLDNMAFCLYELGRIDEAIAKWQQALAIEPNSPDANAGLGMALYVAGHPDDGIAYYRTALQLRAEYADENWLRSVALWSERAIADSHALRAAITP